ncbi:hypothetical protein [Roseovarius amoyensis]|uniref:hypothetical protein n=1 Tax=Roseovarius amoyensis TaxID=2211448 RepID=UPI000DBE71A7|nr:hypothetical protein [Roseovarius amoyensis]
MENEEREGRLLRLTDEMANLALHPLTLTTAERLRHLAGKVTDLSYEYWAGFASAQNAVWQLTGCPLPREVFDEFQYVADSEDQIHHMCAAAIATVDSELEMLIENKIDAYIEDCAAYAEERDAHLDKLADLAAKAEDRPVFRGRRKRVPVSYSPSVGQDLA